MNPLQFATTIYKTEWNEKCIQKLSILNCKVLQFIFENSRFSDLKQKRKFSKSRKYYQDKASIQIQCHYTASINIHHQKGET